MVLLAAMPWAVSFGCTELPASARETLVEARELYRAKQYAEAKSKSDSVIKRYSAFSHALNLRAQVLALCSDGDVNCFQIGVEVLALVDGDVAGVLPVIQAHWKGGGNGEWEVVQVLSGMDARALPALPWLESQRLGAGLAKDELQRLVQKLRKLEPAPGTGR